MPRGNPFLKKNPREGQGAREPGRETFGRGDLLLGGEEGRAGLEDDPSSRMNFAAQLLYSSYLSERLQRLYSPRPALKDTEENDPFWQRWELHLYSPGTLASDPRSQGFNLSLLPPSFRLP